MSILQLDGALVFLLAIFCGCHISSRCRSVNTAPPTTVGNTHCTAYSAGLVTNATTRSQNLTYQRFLTLLIGERNANIQFLFTSFLL